jgi:hypothetical protein
MRGYLVAQKRDIVQSVRTGDKGYVLAERTPSPECYGATARECLVFFAEPPRPSVWIHADELDVRVAV